MVRIAAIPVLLTAWITAASAQPASPPDENTAAPVPASAEMVEQFAKSFATPTRRTGKIARWDNAICPVTVGQPPQFTTFVTRRVKEVATSVGAPVNGAQTCKPNIEIVFTTTPQALLDNVRKHETDFLGYAESSAQKERLATVTHPIQAWYTTETKDLHGMSTMDVARHRITGPTLTCFSCSRCPFCTGLNVPLLDLPDSTSATSGSFISDGARTDFFHIIIVIDANRVVGYQIGPLADYIALVALAQINSLDSCQPLATIVNMLAPGCSQRSTDMTQNDLAYLRGLYGMNPDKGLLFQQNEIANRMKESLGR
jgi:hypothetical protein